MIKESINEILSRENNLLTKNYLDSLQLLEKEFGEKTVTLIEIGSFFEIYETNEVGNATEISNFLNIILTKKNKNKEEVSESNPRLCGIPTVSLDKYIERLIQDDYSVCLIRQIPTANGFIRQLDEIITPGTNIDFINSDSERFIASLKIESFKNDVKVIGITLLEPTLGKVKTLEVLSTLEDKNLAIDEALSILNSHHISELIISSDREYFEFDKFKPSYKEDKESKIEYANLIIFESFNIEETNILTPIEQINIEREIYTLSSLVRLLKYVIRNNKLISSKLSIPTKLFSRKLMYLGNNPMIQLDIINSEKNLLSVVNKGVSAIGKRYIKNQLLNPLYDINEINNRHFQLKKFEDMIDLEDESIAKVTKELNNVYDIERIQRKIEIGTAEPFEVYNLYKTIHSIKNIFEHDSLSENEKLISRYFIVENMIAVTENSFSDNFICNDVSYEIDDKLIELKEKEKKIISIVSSIQDKIKEEKVIFSVKSSTDGLYIDVSRNKFNVNESSIVSALVELGLTYSFKKLKSSVKIYLFELTSISNSIDLIKEKIKKINFIEFRKFLSLVEHSEIDELIKVICSVEFSINNLKLIRNLNFTMPVFVESQDNFYEAKSLRHPIVESVDRERFIPNSIQFGDSSLYSYKSENINQLDSQNGYILFGQNSSGKTVLSKSIGISIILAQAGFAVPASSLRLSLFDGIYTRIVGSDDMAKGRSTFAMEMHELKNILNRATNKSFIIGDEISHGTETTSGLSIVAATIFSLVEMNSSFILSTHLHELDKIKGISELDTVSMIHLALKYNQSLDSLEYNRVIQMGKGKSTYGLEFARSIHLPRDFLEKAYAIRNEIGNISGIEQLAMEKPSKYNPNVFYSSCEKCGERATEIHHILNQKDADENKRHNGVHMNNKSNLLNLCTKCHNLEHKKRTIT